MLYERSDAYRPLFWLGGRPIYVNTLLLILHIAAFALTALAVSLMSAAVLEAISLNTYNVVHYGQIWRLFSYITFPPETAIRFIFAMGFLFYFGRQVEEFVGRKTYIGLFAALVFIPSILLCFLGLFGFWIPYYLGGYGSIFGILVAFATIYPGVEICIWFVNLQAKYWVYALLAAFSMAYIAYHRWIDLGGLWCDAAIGYFVIRLIGGGRGFEWLTDWLDERRTQRLAKQRNIKVMKDTEETESIDAILEKISKQGVGSLSGRERDALERARANLLKRDQH